MKNKRKAGIILLILFLILGGIIFSDKREVYFSAGPESINHRKNELVKVKYFDAIKILKAFDKLKMKKMEPDDTPPIGMGAGIDRYNLRIVDGDEILEVQLWTTLVGGRIYINGEKYFIDIYDEIYDILRNYDDNDGLIMYAHYCDDVLHTVTLRQAFDWTGDWGNQEFYTYGTCYCLGDKKASDVFEHFGESLDTDLSLTEWYLNATKNKVKLSKEVVYNGIGVKLIQIYDLAEDPLKCANSILEYNNYGRDEVLYAFLVKKLSDTGCIETD